MADGVVLQPRLARPPNLNQCREREARAKALWFEGRGPHPHGAVIGWIVPPEITGNCWDTHPLAAAFSEWGNAAGIA